MSVEVTRATPFEQLAEHLSVQESAAYLGLTPWTIYQLVHRGKIPYRRFGKTILIPKEFFNPAKAQATT